MRGGGNMNRLDKVIFGIVVGALGLVSGWIGGSEASKKYHEKQIEKEKNIISNLNSQISLLEQEIINDKRIRKEEIIKMKAKISRLKEGIKVHENKKLKHEIELYRTKVGR